jgi:hypothetical protein
MHSQKNIYKAKTTYTEARGGEQKTVAKMHVNKGPQTQWSLFIRYKNRKSWEQLVQKVLSSHKFNLRATEPIYIKFYTTLSTRSHNLEVTLVV